MKKMQDGLGRLVTRLDVVAGFLLIAWLFVGCAAPIGATQVTTRQSYDQVAANALRTDKPSAETVSLVHRYGLRDLAESHPDQAVQKLHELAVTTGDRELLFALSEMSYVAARQIRRSVTPWDKRDERDYYLGSAVYAWLFLFGEGEDPPPGPYDRRFCAACDFYNYSMGLAFTGRKSTNAIVTLQGGKRRLPVGEIELSVKDTPMGLELHELGPILLADQFFVHGLSARNRKPGIGAPLICVGPMVKELGLRRSTPATALLRLPMSLKEINSGQGKGELEIHSPEDPDVTIGKTQVPIEADLTICLAYNLNQATVWKLGPLQFLDPGVRVKNQLILNQPYDPKRIPLVFVHGTFSSPVTWAEMANTLLADPVLRERYQIWSFVYGSGNSLAFSVADLRQSLTETVARLDPQGTNQAMREMVIIGHSQGGLVVKGTVVETGDKIWNVLSTNRFDALLIPEADRKNLERLLFLKPLPFVSRAVFICTPHRGSYLSGSFARRLAAWFVALPGGVIARSKEMMDLTVGSKGGQFFNGRMPTSLDSMSPKNPALLAMAEIPIKPPVIVNSIVAVQGDGDYHHGRDGLVSYDSAHVDYAESEFIVRSFHSCLDNPATIEEVRRILYEHLRTLPARGFPATVKPQSSDTEKH